MARTKMTEEQKAEKAKLEEEALKANNLIRDLKDLREKIKMGNISSPTIFYKVGESVICGSHKSAIITEVLDEGLIYKIHVVCTNNNYGHPFDYEVDRYDLWMNILPYNDYSVIPNFYKKEFDYERLTFSNTCISSIIHMYYYFGIDLDVSYQRGLIWTLEQKQKLIDSIFKNIPIGSIIYNRLSYKHEGKLYEAIDGKQRISTIIDFYECRFAYKGKTYRELSGRDRNFFKNFGLTEAKTEELDEIQKMNIFIKFNTCGQPQDPNHLSHVKKMMKDLIINQKRDDLAYLIEGEG